MQRRGFIRLVGGGVVVTAGASPLAGCAGLEMPPGAVAAWQGPAADLDADLRRWVLSYAILTPNPHNLQPWIADLRRPGEVLLSLDPERDLPVTDPHGRQILMGAGGFLELLEMAAAERGHRADIRLFPAGQPGGQLDGRPVARIRLLPDAAVRRDPLFAQVLLRRTDRRPYDPAQPVTAAEAEALRLAAETPGVRFGLAGASSADTPRLAALRGITKDAWRIELTTGPAILESLRLLRIGSEEIERYRDGLVADSPMLLVLHRLGMMDRNTAPAPDSIGVRNQIRQFDTAADATPAYLWLVTEGNARAQQVAAGRAYVRANLAGTALGLAMHPVQQALQKYPEVAEPYRAIHAVLDTPAPRFTVQMLARLGRLPAGSDPAPPAPRRGLAAHLVA